MVPALREQHRRLELWLDCMGDAIRQADSAAITTAAGEFIAAALPHYELEEATAFSAAGLPEFTGKLTRQHRQVRELAEALEAAASSADVLRIARELQALAQHNMIEEERDLFPLLGSEAR